jgi:hypothetical protein
MYLITARLRAPDDCEPPTPRMRAHELRDLVLALAAPTDRIEHVYGTATPTGIDLGLFVLQPTFDGAESIVDRLCRRCIDVTPGLAGWSLDGCGAGLVPGLADIVLRPETPGSVLPLQAAASRRALLEN